MAAPHPLAEILDKTLEQREGELLEGERDPQRLRPLFAARTAKEPVAKP